MEHSGDLQPRATRFRYQLIVILFAASIYLVACISPPALMDDVDAVQAQIARNMLDSDDWVTARLNGIAYLEKSPLVYWLMASSYAIFGVQDWAARLPVALSAIVLSWLTCRVGFWAFSERAGFYSGLVVATCVGLFLFTRILIPDVILTTTIALAMWSFARALDAEEPRPRAWSAIMAASIAAGLLLKGLIAAVFPIATAALYLALTRQFPRKRLAPIRGLLIIALIAAPWHILATFRNPPYFDLAMKSEAGQYHGFFWFYFLNEHVFRFLNMRHPRDYNTFPPAMFWLFHLLWLFPWSAYLPPIVKLQFRAIDRAGRMRLLLLCWAGFVMTFFTFSTTQEYYSMPIYPALALLVGCTLAQPERWIRWGSIAVSSAAALAALAIVVILAKVWNLPAPGDISTALVTQSYDAYTLSLGHMGDLTLASFAYLRTPLLLALSAFIIGAIGAWRSSFVAIAVMMVLFLNAARLALVVFDPYLSSRALAEALNRAPEGQLIVDNQYYTFSSIFFYANRQALLLNGRVNNLEYGSYAPGASNVFINDTEFVAIWNRAERYYVLVERPALERIEKLVGKEALHPVSNSGGKWLFTNDANLH